MSFFDQLVRRFSPARRPKSARRLSGGRSLVTKQLPYSRLTLDEWRSSPSRVNYVQSLLADPSFVELVGMLAGIRPVHRGALDSTTAAMLLGQRAGHDQVIASLLAAGTHPPSLPLDIPADYGAEAAMAAWEKEGAA